MDEKSLKVFLQKYHLKPNFTYGQNFLLDDFVLDSIVAASQVKYGDLVLEVGPGIGNLTRALLKAGAYVLAVEKDPKFLPILKSIKRDFSETFRYEIADILEFDYQNFFSKYLVLSTNHSFKVVANIPYYITGKILQLFLENKNRPTSLTLLTQKEVAQGLVAGPGNLSVLAISVQIFGKPSIKHIVPASAFYPVPKVDSAIVNIELNKKPVYNISDQKVFFRILHACFAGKRKQIHNTLKNNLDLSKETVMQILEKLKINPKTRPQELGIEQWVELAELLRNCLLS